MGVLNLALWTSGLAFVVAGWLRGRGPWRRYQALREQDANVARYEAWRGGLRDSGPTAASVAMAVLRRQVRDAAIIAGIGVVLILAGVALPA